ncbi:glycosyltransferase family 4 protein [Tabrizicola soli]|uniref:Glycosyltransferase family 4 protein n=1 Tax=Tabrizicola soli TaxID=2185115 RepID=A0ABV7DW90_9RHOB|nr:glycosyltransferase family 4 protein [Tabrizicola soli]
MPANAAIWFAADGYDPAARGINGRRVAGESFLRGFFAHGAVEEFVSLAHASADHAAFAAMARAAGVTRPLRAVRLDAPAAMRPVEVVSYPAPLDPVECWRRAPHGGAAWALTGITHTISTNAVMRCLFELRSAPQMPWDALICTSHAVQAAVRRLMELGEDQLARRFPGAVLPARPLLPVIPLGVHCDEFAPDPAAGTGLRARLGIAPEDVVAATIARLTPDEKFDPFPLFLAMQEAQSRLSAAGGGRMHLILCGQFRVSHWNEVFRNGAAQLMPSCGYHLLDGGNAAERRATLSAADIFVFPIDNVQETFGLAPVEAMAAGLPVVVSDWDGLKDTVTPETGFRIPTELPGQGALTHLSQRHLGGTDDYVQYVGQLAALTRLDVGALAGALTALATDPDLRARMGAAGRARARALYDWRVVIPQIQALWAEQVAMLAHARRRPDPRHAPLDAALIPTGPAPDLMFAAYPTAFQPGTRRLRPVPLGTRPDLPRTFALRDYRFARRFVEDPARLRAILAAYAPEATAEAVAAATGLAPASIARATAWLLKYHFLEEAP